MEDEIVNIREVQDSVNGFLFGIKGIGLKELQLSNEVVEYFGRFVNETVTNYNAL